MIRALVMTHVFPRPMNLSFGVFVRQRAVHVAREVGLEVVAPLPWFPGGHWVGRVRRASVPRQIEISGLPVHYPTVPSIPGVGRSFDPLFFAVALLPFLRRLRRRFPFDLIDSHFGYPDGVAAALLGSWLACPVLITLRGSEHEIATRPLRRRQLAWALRRTRVIAVSTELAQLARELGAASVRTIPNGIDASLFGRGDRAAARRALGLPADATILLGAASFVFRKRHDRLLRVVAGLRDAGHTQILYVGVGGSGGTETCLSDLRRLVGELGLESHVRLVTDRPHEEMPQWFRAADVCCMASTREGSPNVILEALACGLPVVAVGVGEIPSVVRHGVDGYVLPHFDATEFQSAIATALETPWDRNAIAAHGSQRSWDDAAHEVVEEMRAAVGLQ